MGSSTVPPWPSAVDRSRRGEVADRAGRGTRTTTTTTTTSKKTWTWSSWRAAAATTTTGRRRTNVGVQRTDVVVIGHYQLYTTRYSLSLSLESLSSVYCTMNIRGRLKHDKTRMQVIRASSSPCQWVPTASSLVDKDKCESSMLMIAFDWQDITYY